MMNDQSVRLDRMRFTKNTTSSRLVLLAIVLDALYFVSLYRINLDYYYNMMFMLAAFLASEGVKNYKQSFSGVLCVLGVIQIARIFILPVPAHQATVTVGGTELLAMSNGQFTWSVIYLVGSAACLFVAAVINFTKSRALKAHIAGLEGQKA